MANPLIDGMSFDDFQKQVNGGKKSDENSKKKQKVQNKVNMEKQVHSAELILKNFVPPGKKGGVE